MARVSAFHASGLLDLSSPCTRSLFSIASVDCESNISEICRMFGQRKMERNLSRSFFFLLHFNNIYWIYVSDVLFRAFISKKYIHNVLSKKYTSTHIIF